MERLGSESSVLRFRAEGKPAQRYVVEFRGRSLARERGKVSIRDRHEVEIKLGSSYPRTMPEIRWLTPIYHPNISEIGMVCLGGYGTHWVPSLNLDELCGMLWDMARFHNYDIRSPYNREAALWVANQSSFLFPLDARALRDLRVALGRVDSHPSAAAVPAPSVESEPASQEPAAPKSSSNPVPGSRAGKYADFVRKFASDLSALKPTLAESSPQVPEAWNGSGVAGPEGMIILDMEVDLRPAPPGPRPGSGPGDEIVFID
ncbi:ubiquitin-conjugating enzyme E2 [Singulisphaera sp. GP187]|uniref:ubiquitin-conjugating enzyme E2 n=1 Tax=Singulisphaera sp. GP187 TaxID=1882752 RepID=UPI0020B13812|nr:ubiquitin-conjugating enzyme E2 [Singulisphaera sp. GP187]